jgi:hypothetical protein
MVELDCDRFGMTSGKFGSKEDQHLHNIHSFMKNELSMNNKWQTRDDLSGRVLSHARQPT